MELSANELRIGNLITIDNSVYWIELRDIPLIVTHIGQTMNIKGESSHSVGCEHTNPKTNTYYEIYPQFIENIKPIQLTEEWLLKFGFEKDNELNFVKFSFKVHFWSNYNSYMYGWIGGNIEIKYVHQLQNIYFALTGQELTI